ncbi:histidine kinase [Paenibacillus sp. GD4]|uniref:sensor histidine kinase n=1 Tax=Paenibacillus sp. GD4 TaxID=3068890 RepID=UPI0027968220|nr:sensor histidine kinase [Paenibacillus sp. GD4]MDQ1912600.1 histidine kinase [Paenibacillus sp. GD4]
MPVKKLVARWKSSLKWKLVSIFVAIVLSNLLVIAYLVNEQVTNAIEHDDIQFSRLVLKQANLNLVRYLQDYDHFMITLGTSQELQAWTSLSGEKAAASIVPYSVIQREYIRPFASSHPELVSIFFYNKNGNEVPYSPKYGIRYGYSLRAESWIDQVPPVGNMTFIVEQSKTYVDTDLKPLSFPVISIIKRFGYNGSTYVKMDILPTLLQSILNEINLGENGVGLIVDAKGKIIAHPQTDRFQTQLDRTMMDRMTDSDKGAFVLDNPKEIVIFEAIAGTNWKSVIILPYREIVGSIYKIRNAMLITTGICLVLSAFLIVLVSSSVTRRLTTIRQRMKQTGQGQMDVPVAVEGQDEISSVAQSYNLMLEDLQLHIKRLAESKLVEQQSVLFSLQSQIDAHFLYNTLEIINSMASKIKHKEIEQITVSLAHMFRYTASYKVTEVTLRDELQHLRRYLGIIQIRFGELFTYDLEVDEACLDIKCLKVILQPIAENAVKHGFEKTGTPIHLTIRIRLDSRKEQVMVTFADNGKGFEPEKLTELQGQLRSSNLQYSEFKRIGLLNIQYRLITRYHETAAGIDIFNREEGGAVVSFTFPLNR